MFGKNKSLSVKIVNDKKSEDTTPAAAAVAARSLIAQIKTKDVVKVTAGVVATYASIVAINTLATIAENRFSN